MLNANKMDIVGHIYIAITIILTVYGQLVIKWQVVEMKTTSGGLSQKILFILSCFANPWILSGLAGAFFAAVAWMLAMTRFELSYAYPFTSLGFVGVTVFSMVFLHESLNLNTIVGTTFVIIGLIILSR